MLSDGELRLEERAGHLEVKNSPETRGTPVGLLKAVYTSPVKEVFINRDVYMVTKAERFYQFNSTRAQ